AWAYDYKAARRVRKVPVIDPMPMLCPGGWCRAVDGNYLIYRNQGHLTATFTREKYGWIGLKLGDPWR
ncbi:MAG TPA: SGNH hydrolase domain-containing protein, partial [Solirubrobacterales bacterium]|nr:SGNH hydrolase domain-containing protein [Solirubrobacterales bacterium]